MLKSLINNNTQPQKVPTNHPVTSAMLKSLINITTKSTYLQQILGFNDSKSNPWAVAVFFEGEQHYLPFLAHDQNVRVSNTAADDRWTHVHRNDLKLFYWNIH